MTDDKFTNKSDIEYPLENDFVDIKVLNNNTKILDDKKANTADLKDVARESQPRAIENGITSIKNSVDANLQEVAKETEQYSIENKLKTIEDRMSKENWLALPNLKAVYKQIPKAKIQTPETEIYSVTGKGNLICVMANVYTSKQTFYLKIEIDDQVIFNVKVNFDRSLGGRNYYLGILNDTYYTNLKQNNNSIYRQIALARATSSNNSAPIDIIYENLINLSNNLYTVDASTIHQENITGQSYVLPATAIIKTPIKFNNKLKIFMGADAKLNESDPSLSLIYNLDR